MNDSDLEQLFLHPQRISPRTKIKLGELFRIEIN